MLCPASTQAPAHTNGHMQGMHTRRNAVAASHHRTITSAQHSHTHAMPAITSTSLDPGTTHKQCTVQPQSKQAHTPALLLHPAAAPPPPSANHTASCQHHLCWQLQSSKTKLANPHLPQSDSKETILSIRWPTSSINQSYSGPSPHPASCAARRALRFARLPEPGVLPADAP